MEAPPIRGGEHSQKVYMDNKTYIPMNKCKDGHLYIIDARNADIGVYIAKEKGFKISRFKFKSNFIFIEYHWDTGEPFGTVKPLKKLNYIGHMSDEKLFSQLNDEMKRLFYDIKKLKGVITTPITLVDPDRMKRLKMLHGGD